MQSSFFINKIRNLRQFILGVLINEIVAQNGKRYYSRLYGNLILGNLTHVFRFLFFISTTTKIINMATKISILVSLFDQLSILYISWNAQSENSNIERTLTKKPLKCFFFWVVWLCNRYHMLKLSIKFWNNFEVVQLTFDF